MLNKKLEELKQKLVSEALLAEKMTRDSVDGLIKKDEDMLNEVINRMENEINSSEVEIDEMGTALIALYQPEAGDLRTILTILKINSDLERIGDLAVNIAQSSLYLIKQPPVKPLIDIPRMAEETTMMLHDAITSFINRDTQKARNVCKRDYIVDSLRDQILRELITYMTGNPSTIERAIHLIRISRSLERIGDLSTNICENTVYMAEGKIIKHNLGQNDDQ